MLISLGALSGNAILIETISLRTAGNPSNNMKGSRHQVGLTIPPELLQMGVRTFISDDILRCQL